MNGFLHDIAHALIENYGNDMSGVSVIFPNRRAGLYLRSILMENVKGPAWSPQILSMREFVESQSIETVPDVLTLNFLLHQEYRQIMHSEEGFEDFYYWGQILLKDFDEVDKYLVNAKTLYTDLSNQKELDAVFDFLTDHQKQLVRQFWRGFDDRKSESKDKFLNVWSNLFTLYTQFNARLRQEGMAYEGTLYRTLAEDPAGHEWKLPGDLLWFAGFNALTASEEKIISYFLDNQRGKVFWDVDSYYLSDRKQEAGRFFREYSGKRVFSGSFPNPEPRRISDVEKDVEIVGVPQFVGQTKACANALRDYLVNNPGVDQRKIAVIIADETLLLPVLHSLPDEVQQVNITMGFPLMFAPLTGFIEELIELIEFSRLKNQQRTFHFRSVQALINHPLMQQSFDDQKREELEDSPKLFWPDSVLVTDDLTRLIFSEDPSDFVVYLIAILEELAVANHESEIENSYLHHYLKHLTRYHELMADKIPVDMFRRLFGQLARLDRIPFTGEPLKGLQIMGVLETRNLDFEVIFVLGMNEESFPGGRNQHSYVPYNLRKAYELPHFDQQDAIYAYLFYRLFHNARTARLYYNTEGNDLGGEEMSRFLKQLIFEKPFPVKQTVLKNIPFVETASAISLKQDSRSLERLKKYEEKSFLSPSAVNTYLECRLKFYFRYIMGVREKDEQEDYLDARTLGLLVHKCLENMFRVFEGKMVEAGDIDKLKKQVNEEIVIAFREIYQIGDDEEFEPEGKNVVASEIAKSFVKRILKTDREYAPFRVLGVEKTFKNSMELSDGKRIQIGGNIDRIDEKEGLIRILDLKTGADKREFDGVESFFNRDSKRNKAAFQTFFYSLLYPDDQQRLVPSVYNKTVLFGKEPMGFADTRLKAEVTNFGNYRDEYISMLRDTLNEIFDDKAVFDQVEDENTCKYCDYNVICQRR